MVSPAASTSPITATGPAVPSRAPTRPDSGMELTDPTARARSTSRRARGESPSASRTCGIRDAQLANANPLRMKTAYTAPVARRTAREGESDGTVERGWKSGGGGDGRGSLGRQDGDAERVISGG